MRIVIFKPYSGTNRLGGSAVFDCSDYGAKDLLKMLDQPLHLQVVSFRTGHQIWVDHLADIFLEQGGRAAGDFTNLGFAKALASLGFRVVPAAHEIEIR